MSEIKFSCHACGQVLQVGGDKAGRKAKCVQCGTVLTIPAGGDAPVQGIAAVPRAAGPGPLELPAHGGYDPDRDEAEIEIADSRRPPRVDERTERDDRDRRDGSRSPRDDDDSPRRRRRDAREGDDDDWDDRDRRVVRPKASPWEKVRIGFLIAFIALCVMAGAHGIGVLGILVGMASFGGGLALARIAAFLMFLGTIGVIVGHVFWLFVSNRNNLFAYAVAALAVAGFYLLMQMVVLVMLFNPIGAGLLFIVLLVDLTQAAHFILIGLFLRALGQQLDEPHLEKSTLVPMILAAAHGGYGLLTKVIMMSLAGAVNFGAGYRILTNILGFLGAALVTVVFVFILLAVYRGKQLVDRV